MLLWVFVIALVLSHVSRFYQSKVVGFTNFAVNDHEICEWISRIDPTARIGSGGGSFSSSDDHCDADMDKIFLTKNITSEELIAQIRDGFGEKAKQDGWAIELGEGENSFEFGLSKGASRFRVWCWLLPAGDGSYPDGIFVTRVKVLQVGYRIR